jgi:AmmeMemoRadiSam system protein B
MHTIRQAAVAGSFYSGDAQTLIQHIRAFLHAALTDTECATPKAIIVPHAAYIYSGQTAAIAYAQLLPVRGSIKRVILLGPMHRVGVRGLALAEVDHFSTPLGEVEIDQTAIVELSVLKQIEHSAAAHAHEHSLEVQLPFLQTVVDDFKLVPLAVGDATPAEVAEVLELLWGGPETLIVISSDLSHYLPYQLAQRLDHETIAHILALQPSLTHEQACGGSAINGLLLAAKQHQLQVKLLDVCNSGDTAGDKERVVGYAAFSFMSQAAHA